MRNMNTCFAKFGTFFQGGPLCFSTNSTSKLPHNTQLTHVDLCFCLITLQISIFLSVARVLRCVLIHRTSICLEPIQHLNTSPIHCQGKAI